MKKVLFFLLAFVTLSAFNVNADRLSNHTDRVNSNAIKIGVFRDGLTHYMRGYTVTCWYDNTGKKIGELSIGLDKHDRLWIINRTDRRLRIPFCYDVKKKGVLYRHWKTIILDPGEFEAPDLELKEGETLSTNINAICLTAYSDATSPKEKKLTILE